MLNQLKTDFNKLVIDTNEKVKEIEDKLGQELPCYKNMSTEIDLNGLNESQSINLYELKIDGLKAKLNHSDDFLKAVIAKKDLKEFDFFGEIKNKPEEDNR